MSKLEVEISGDVKKLKSAINDATGQLKGLAKQGIDSGKKVNRNALSAARGIKGLGNETVNAFPALNEFSRIIQDAPYGIQGVANNITQLTTQFGYLTKKTGSAKGALKAMLGSLTGPSGILLAVSAVTTLLVSFGDKLFSSSKNADKLKSSTKGLNKELESQSAILKKLIPDYLTFASIKEKTIFNTTKEKEEVKALFAVLRDESKTVDQRTRAYKSLEKSYTKYLKGVKPKDAAKLANAEKQIVEQLEIREKKAQTLIKLEETTRSLQLLNLKITKQKAAADLKGIDISDSKKRKLSITESYIRKKIEERTKAKNEGNFSLADKIRKELLLKGILIEDQKEKTIWKFK